MSLGITMGRLEPCRNNVGGIKALYVFNYVKYNYSQIKGKRGKEVTEFPTSQIFKYETTEAQFSESVTNDDEGVKYDQSINFKLLKQDLETSLLLKQLEKVDLRCVVEYNNGKLRVAGLWNGLRVSTNSNDSGGGKNSFNGYSITLNGSEEYSAAYIDSLDVILGNNSFLLLEDDFYILLEDGGKIILE